MIIALQLIFSTMQLTGIQTKHLQYLKMTNAHLKILSAAMLNFILFFKNFLKIVFIKNMGFLVFRFLKYALEF